MPLNSVNTNMGAMVALQSLNATNQQLQTTQKHISTGYRVSDATDDGAAYAVAQSIRSDVGALTSANQQLSQASSGLLATTITGLNNISAQMATMKATLAKLADSSLSSTERTQYQTDVSNDLADIKNYISDSNYNGKTLIGNFGTAAGFGSVNVVRNEQGSQYTISSTNAAAIYAGITSLANASTTSTQIAAALTATGAFSTQFNAISSALNTYGNASNYVNAQVTFNNDRIDAMNSGLGALVDANLSQEAANLQALQTRQQLGTQALSLANQAPNSLLSLFK